MQIFLLSHIHQLNFVGSNKYYNQLIFIIKWNVNNFIN